MREGTEAMEERMAEVNHDKSLREAAASLKNALRTAAALPKSERETLAAAWRSRQTAATDRVVAELCRAIARSLAPPKRGANKERFDI